jgi:hypothetical protein
MLFLDERCFGLKDDDILGIPLEQGQMDAGVNFIIHGSDQRILVFEVYFALTLSLCMPLCLCSYVAAGFYHGTPGYAEACNHDSRRSG